MTRTSILIGTSIILLFIFSCQNDAIEIKVDTITISPNVKEVILYKDISNTKTFVAKAFDSQKLSIEDATIDWTTSDSNLAAINEFGEATFIDYGLVTISASSGNVVEDLEINIIEQPSLSFISNPPSAIGYNERYNYTPLIQSLDGEPVLDFTMPAWLTYESATNTISGIPGWDNLNQSFNIQIKASNEIVSITQLFNLTIEIAEIDCNVNFGDPSESLYILPFEVGKQYKLSQSYCPSNAAWGHHQWFAYDFDMEIGERLIAARAGEVIAIKESNADGTRDCSGGFENYIFILHNDGTVANYVHLTKNGVEVSVGQKVEQGEFIGLSGDSGCSIGPHLHFSVFRQRGPYDRQYTMPINFRNAIGTLNASNGLIGQELYKADTF